VSIFITGPIEPGDGVRLAVKDLFDTAGTRTTYGSAVFADHVPSRTAAAVERLEAAGYATVGKANLHEFAYGITSHNPHFGDVPNPLYPGRTAGGSSSGSAAALAAGLADAALGTDSGGSIRIPAACCGVVGFKPTHGLVPMDGCFPLAPTYDHAGPMARAVAGCVRMLGALAPEFEPVVLESLEELKVGVAWLEHANPLVRARVEEAAAAFPQRRNVDFPFPEGVGPVFMREVAVSHEGLYPDKAELYGPNLREKMEWSLAVTDGQYEQALRRREEHRTRAAEALAGLDLLITPTLAFVAPPATLTDLEIRESVLRFTYPFNALGWPALALPCGPAEHGLPASVQLVAPAGGDGLVLAAGTVLDRRPSTHGIDPLAERTSR
jgi:aspartyl-tRNA(Asn)/glutamyl-tRNA(Gln) amidotransferase subunit A